VLIIADAVVRNAIALDVIDGRIVGVRVISNPEKLTGLHPA
jgi:hypothetical protein